MTTHHESQPQSGVEMIAKPFNHPSPSKIVGQVLGCDSMETKHPPFQARMVSVHILDVINPGQHPNALAQVDCTVSSPHFASCQCEGPLSSTVGAEDGIRGQERFQDSFDRLVVVPRKNRIEGGSRAIPNGQNRNLFEGESALRRPTAPFPRSSRKMPLSLERTQEIGFVCFDDSSLLSSPEDGGQGQETMPPEEGCFLVDGAAPSGFSDRFALGEFLQIQKPAVFVMKTRQGSLRQRTKGSFAPLAPIAREPGRTAPRPDAGMIAMRATGGDSHQSCDLNHQVLLVPFLKSGFQIVSLGRCQGRDQPQPSMECELFHGRHLLCKAYTRFAVSQQGWGT